MKPHSQAGLGNSGKGERALSVSKPLTCSEEHEWGAHITCCREDLVFGGDGAWPLSCGPGLFMHHELLQAGQERQGEPGTLFFAVPPAARGKRL